jgi:hypothetical protein
MNMKSHYILSVMLALSFFFACSGSTKSGLEKDTTEEVTGPDGIEGKDAEQDISGPDTDASADAVDGTDAGYDIKADRAVDLEKGCYPLVEPKAYIYEYPKNIGDDLVPVEKTLNHLTDPNNYMTGNYAKVYNCLLETLDENEYTAMGYNIWICDEVQTVCPGPDGTYKHAKPPLNDTEAQDKFAEVNTYYHMNQIHDYLLDAHGIEYQGIPGNPLVAVVNAEPCIEFYNTQVWVPIDNAAFIPAYAADDLARLFGIDFSRDFDSLIFAQGNNRDPAYDASVIYHEYIHAVINVTRLSAIKAYEYGPNNQAISLNEAHADYFAATLLDDPVIGKYFMADIMGELMIRSLTDEWACPDSLTGEVHADGQIFSSALWKIREALGKELADQIIADSLMQYTNQTDFNLAGETIISEAAKLTPPRDTEVRQILENRGLIQCKPIRACQAPCTNLITPDLPGPYILDGRQTTGILYFSKFVPGYVEHTIEIKAEDGINAIIFRYKASAAGLMSFIPGFSQPVDVRVALTKDEPITYVYDPGGFSMTSTADWISGKATADGEYSVVKVFGNCLTPGVYYVQFLNYSNDQAYIESAEVTLSKDAPSNEDPTFDTCQ